MYYICSLLAERYQSLYISFCEGCERTKVLYKMGHTLKSPTTR